MNGSVCFVTKIVVIFLINAVRRRRSLKKKMSDIDDSLHGYFANSSSDDGLE